MPTHVTMNLIGGFPGMRLLPIVSGPMSLADGEVVTVAACDLCGSVVFDRTQHLVWHASLEPAEES